MLRGLPPDSFGVLALSTRFGYNTTLAAKVDFHQCAHFSPSQGNYSAVLGEPLHELAGCARACVAVRAELVRGW